MVSKIKGKLRLFLPRFKQTKKLFGLKKAVGCIFKFVTPHLLKPFHGLYWKYLQSISKSEYILRNIHGYKMYLSLKDAGISKDLAINKTREELQTELVMKTVNNGMRILDIGANIGYYALMEASLVGPQGKVYAVEPSIENIKLLKKNIEVNRFENIIGTENIAISDKNSKARFYVSEKSNLNTLSNPNNSFNKLLKLKKDFVEVQTLTVDKFLENKPAVDFIRMDVEGYEINIFKGMKKTLKSKHPLKIFFEAHPFLYDNPKNCVKSYLSEFRKYGFEVKAIVDRYTLLKPKSIENSVEIICDKMWAPSILLERGK